MLMNLYVIKKGLTNKMFKLTVFTYGGDNTRIVDFINNCHKYEYPVYVDSSRGNNLEWLNQNNECGYFFYFGDDERLNDVEYVDDVKRKGGHQKPEYFFCCDKAEYAIKDAMFFILGMINGREPDLLKYPNTPVVKSVEEYKKFEMDENDIEYGLSMEYLGDRLDMMIYEVKKPRCEQYYTTIVKQFSKNGHRDFFSNLYICDSWGREFNPKDNEFLVGMWGMLNMEGECDLVGMLREATEQCLPSGAGEGGRIREEPEVWRKSLLEVKEIVLKKYKGLLIYFFFFSGGGGTSKLTVNGLNQTPSMSETNTCFLFFGVLVWGVLVINSKITNK